MPETRGITPDARDSANVKTDITWVNGTIRVQAKMRLYRLYFTALVEVDSKHFIDAVNHNRMKVLTSFWEH